MSLLPKGVNRFISKAGEEAMLQIYCASRLVERVEHRRTGTSHHNLPTRDGLEGARNGSFLHEYRLRGSTHQICEIALVGRDILWRYVRTTAETSCRAVVLWRFHSREGFGRPMYLIFSHGVHFVAKQGLIFGISETRTTAHANNDTKEMNDPHDYTLIGVVRGNSVALVHMSDVYPIKVRGSTR